MEEARDKQGATHLLMATSRREALFAMEGGSTMTMSKTSPLLTASFIQSKASATMGMCLRRKGRFISSNDLIVPKKRSGDLFQDWLECTARSKFPIKTERLLCNDEETSGDGCRSLKHTVNAHNRVSSLFVSLLCLSSSAESMRNTSLTEMRSQKVACCHQLCVSCVCRAEQNQQEINL